MPLLYLLGLNGTSINRAGVALLKPVVDANFTESMLTLRSLNRFLEDSRADRTDKLLIDAVVCCIPGHRNEPRHIESHL